jgi:hypothetical protein
LELDHAEPRGLGGGDGPDNVRVRCRAHNQLAAEEVYGRHHIELARHLRQQKCRRDQAENPHKADAARTKGAATARRPEKVGSADARSIAGNFGTASASGTLEKVRLALTSMGFRNTEARKAIVSVVERHGETQSVEVVLREALLFITQAPRRVLGSTTS